MNKLIGYFKWPYKKGNGLVPWYVILWRIPWLIIGYLGISLVYIGLCSMYGHRRAIENIKLIL